MDWKSTVCAGAAGMAACALLRAADTNSMGEMFALPDLQMSVSREQNPGVIAEFERHIANIGPTITIDRFGQLSRFDWLERSETDRYAFISEWNASGRGAFKDIAVSSLRETFVGLPGIDEQESVWADILKGTVGNTAEQRLDLTSPTANASLVSWEKEWQENSDLSYGLRPFDSRPYVYESMAIRNRSGKVCWYEDVRVRYVPFDRLWLEGTTIIPMSASWQVNIGAAGDPLRLGGKGSGSSASVGLSRIFTLTQTLSGGMGVNETGRLSFTFEFTREF